MSKRNSKICRVCGDKATAFNFNGLTCECCKIFFRRNAKKTKLKCRLEGACPIDFYTRKGCPACRLAKCLAIGMKLPGESNTLRQILQFPETLTESLPETLPETLPVLIEPTRETSLQLSAFESGQIDLLNGQLSIFALESTLPVISVMEDVTYCFNLPGLYAKKIVKLCKTFEQFKALPETQQLTILKEFYFEFCMVRFSLCIDTERDCTRMISDESATSVYLVPYQLLNDPKIGVWGQENRKFAYTLYYALEGDLTIANLLTAQFLFSKRSPAVYPESFQYCHSVYNRLLLRYLESKYNDATLAEHKYAFLLALISPSNLKRMKDNVMEVFDFFPLNSDGQILKEVFSP